MNLMFACAMEDEQGPERTHQTSTAMRKCGRCGKYAVAGYQCEEEGCGHSDISGSDQLFGHGEGKCEAAA